MYYNFGQNSGEKLQDGFDIKTVKTHLIQIFETDDDEKLAVEFKKLIKDKKRLDVLLDEIKMDVDELIEISVKMYPQMYNHHLIEYVKEHYINDNPRKNI